MGSISKPENALKRAVGLRWCLIFMWECDEWRCKIPIEKIFLSLSLSLSLSFVMEAAISATLSTRIISQKKSSEEIVSKRISILSLSLSLSLFISSFTHTHTLSFSNNRRNSSTLDSLCRRCKRCTMSSPLEDIERGQNAWRKLCSNTLNYAWTWRKDAWPKMGWFNIV